jgi:hypothetical protein
VLENIECVCTKIFTWLKVMGSYKLLVCKMTDHNEMYYSS